MTGGPKGGKTTAIAMLAEKLANMGFKVYQPPSCTKITENGGFTTGRANISKMKPDILLKFAIAYIKMVIEFENYFYECAQQDGNPSIILCHKGVMDIKGQMNPDTWEAILNETGWNEVNLRDKRYDVVLHLVTAADGAEKYFGSDNREMLDSALHYDETVKQAWNGHPKLKIIGNFEGESFQNKMSQCFYKICSDIGLPTENKFFKKFLVDIPPNVTNFASLFPESLIYHYFEMEELFLNAQDPRMQIRLTKRVFYFL